MSNQCRSLLQRTCSSFSRTTHQHEWSTVCTCSNFAGEETIGQKDGKSWLCFSRIVSVMQTVVFQGCRFLLYRSLWQFIDSLCCQSYDLQDKPRPSYLLQLDHLKVCAEVKAQRLTPQEAKVVDFFFFLKKEKKSLWREQTIQAFLLHIIKKGTPQSDIHCPTFWITNWFLAFFHALLYVYMYI